MGLTTKLPFDYRGFSLSGHDQLSLKNPYAQQFMNSSNINSTTVGLG